MKIRLIKSKDNFIVKVIYYITLIIALFLSTPYLSRNCTQIMLLLVFGWSISVIALFFIKGIRIKQIRLSILLIIWISIIIFYRVIGKSSASLGNYYEVILFYFSFFVMLIADSYFSQLLKKRLAICIIIFISLNLVHNIYLNSLYPYASTVIMTPDGASLLSTNVGSTSFSTMIYIFIGIMLILYFNIKSFTFKIFSLVTVILACYLILFQHARATSTILTMLLLGGLLIDRLLIKFHKNEKFIMKIGLLFILCICLIPFLNIIIDKIDNERLASRIEWFRNLLTGNLSIGIIDQNSLSTRLYLIQATIKTFFTSTSNFLFGVGYNLTETKSIQQMLAITGVGYHSELIDVLGTYGIIGGYFLYSILYQYWKMIKIGLSKRNIQQYKAIYTGFIIYCSFNLAFHGEIAVSILLLLPFSKYLLSDFRQES